MTNTTTTARDRALLGPTPTTIPATVSAGPGGYHHGGGVASVLQPGLVLPVATHAPSGTAPGSSMAAILKRETEQQEKERQAKVAEQVRLQQQAVAAAALRQQQQQQQQQQAVVAQAAALRQQQEAALRQQQQQQQQQQAQQQELQQHAFAAQQKAAQQQQQLQQQTQIPGVGSGGSLAGPPQEASKSSSSVVSGNNSVTSAGLDIIAGLNGLGLTNHNTVPDGGSVGSAVSHHKRSMSGDVNSLLGNTSNSNNNSNSTTTNGNGTTANPAGGGGGAAGAVAGSGSTNSTTGLLQESFATLPQSHEHDRTNIRSNSYTPQNPYPATPASYPTQPNAIFENPAIFEKLGTDALFYIFYYKQGSYQQYLAARELKKQSWRFHKKYMTWFQRHEEPKITTDEYEQGTYVYFDWETGWCTRIKQDFRFEYSFLEDTLQ
mmetsp:Transcript_14624/g.15978  ORF Transcript_14624/g.15978 Transcript_14624/m.15978 type:complete len:434 (+) Transcript_14624:1-1302(+)